MATERDTWQRPTAFYNRTVKWLFYVVSTVFLLGLLIQTGVSVRRFFEGLLYGTDLIRQMLPPTASPEQFWRMIEKLGESVAMSMLATAIGVTISIPIG